MEIRRFPSELLASNTYLIVEDQSALVIDPCRDTTLASGLTVERILLTHEHYDHISGVNAWKAATGAPVLCSKACAANIVDPRKNLARIFEVFCELQTWIELDRIPASEVDYSCTADETFEDRFSFIWKGHRIDLMEIPGHSQGSIGITLDDRCFFSGDSLMEDRDIELRFPGGSKKQWEAVGAPRIRGLPEGILIYPGHFGTFEFRRPGGGD